MSPEIFDQVEKDVLPFLDECKVGGNSLGEQLTARRWDLYSERLGDYPFSRTLVTNGLLLDAKKIGKLAKDGWTIDFSTEGAKEETYRSIRGADFGRFLAVVHESCRQKKILGGSRADIRLCLTAFYENIREFPELIRLAARLGVDEVCVTHLIPTTEDQRNQSLVYHKGLANDVFEQGSQLARELGLSLRLPPPFPVLKMGEARGAGHDESSGIPRKRCDHPWTSVSITEKGDVMPCCLYETSMGNLQKDRFEEIWNHRRYRKLRETVNSPTPMGRCRECPLRGNEFTSVNCSDDRALLGVIGLTNHLEVGTFIRLKIREILNGSPRRRALLAKTRAAYRKWKSL